MLATISHHGVQLWQTMAAEYAPLGLLVDAETENIKNPMDAVDIRFTFDGRFLLLAYPTCITAWSVETHEMIWKRHFMFDKQYVISSILLGNIDCRALVEVSSARSQYFVISADSGKDIGREFHLDDTERRCRTYAVGGKGGDFILATPAGVRAYHIVLKEFVTGRDLERFKFDALIELAVFNAEGDKIVFSDRKKYHCVFKCAHSDLPANLSILHRIIFRLLRLQIFIVGRYHMS